MSPHLTRNNSHDASMGLLYLPIDLPQKSTTCIGKYTILALVHESYIPRFTVFAPGFVEGLVVKVLDWKLFSPGTIDSFNRPPRCQFRTININFLSFHECRRPKDPEGARIMLTS